MERTFVRKSTSSNKLDRGQGKNPQKGKKILAVAPINNQLLYFLCPNLEGSI